MGRAELEDSGTIFEMTIALQLANQFPKGFVLQDVKLFSPFLGKNTQIDLILISENGIFVIEAKNWKKSISGTVGARYWEGSSNNGALQVISPFDQNFLHIRLLRNWLRRKGMNPVRFHNIICVPDGTEIRCNFPTVCTLSQLEKVILQYSDTSIDVISYKKLISRLVQ